VWLCLCVQSQAQSDSAISKFGLSKAADHTRGLRVCHYPRRPALFLQFSTLRRSDVVHKVSNALIKRAQGTIWRNFAQRGTDTTYSNILARLSYSVGESETGTKRKILVKSTPNGGTPNFRLQPCGGVTQPTAAGARLVSALFHPGTCFRRLHQHLASYAHSIRSFKKN
jgi:hypothetical protein